MWDAESKNLPWINVIVTVVGIPPIAVNNDTTTKSEYFSSNTHIGNDIKKDDDPFCIVYDNYRPTFMEQSKLIIKPV